MFSIIGNCFIFRIENLHINHVGPQRKSGQQRKKVDQRQYGRDLTCSSPYETTN
jgi:hypothetical protein